MPRLNLQKVTRNISIAADECLNCGRKVEAAGLCSVCLEDDYTECNNADELYYAELEAEQDERYYRELEADWMISDLYGHDYDSDYGWEDFRD